MQKIIIHTVFKNIILGSPEKSKEEMMFEIYGILYKSYWYYGEFDMMLFKQPASRFKLSFLDSRIGFVF